jgi:hypothetical protein
MKKVNIFNFNEVSNAKDNLKKELEIDIGLDEIASYFKSPHGNFNIDKSLELYDQKNNDIKEELGF